VLGDGAAALLLRRDVTLQRLFSTFPDGAPGRGLLLLRISIGLPLICWGVADLHTSAPDLSTILPDLVAAAAGVLVIAGLGTPLAGALIAVVEAGLAFSPGPVRHVEEWVYLLLAALSASLGMLGPGAWSLDARLYGRKVFTIGDRYGGRPER